jgi:hypothetical protein
VKPSHGTHPATAAARRARERALLVKSAVEDALLDKHEAAAILAMGPETFVRYAARWPSLARGARVVRVRPSGRGRVRWLKSAVLEHLRLELLTPDVVNTDRDERGDTQ